MISEDGDQRTEIRGQRSEDRIQITDGGNQKAEWGSRKKEI
jgi:hypothetical protein